MYENRGQQPFSLFITACYPCLELPLLCWGWTTWNVCGIIFAAVGGNERGVVACCSFTRTDTIPGVDATTVLIIYTLAYLHCLQLCKYVIMV